MFYFKELFLELGTQFKNNDGQILVTNTDLVQHRLYFMSIEKTEECSGATYVVK